MNSLVVLFSLVALAAAKPSGLLQSEVLSYAAPAVVSAIPSAVSSQSRIDIKSSPAVVSSYISAPIATAAIAPTFIKSAAIAAPAIEAYSAPALYKSAIIEPVIAAPAAVSHQSRIDIKSSPAVVSSYIPQPIAAIEAYSAPAIYKAAIAAPAAAVSHQSRFDIKSSPAVVSSYISQPIAAIETYSAPAIYKAAIAAPAAAVSHQSRFDIKSSPAVVSSYISPALTAIAEPVYAAPAIIAEPSVPLDTPEVIAARQAHFQAKALQGHYIHKRSAPLISQPILTTYGAAPLLSTYSAAPLLHSASLLHSAPLTYAAPFTYQTPIIAKAYGVHPW